MLPDAEITRTLMRYRYDRAFRGDRRVPISALDAQRYFSRARTEFRPLADAWRKKHQPR
jgi:hypothetical protein